MQYKNDGGSISDKSCIYTEVQGIRAIVKSLGLENVSAWLSMRPELRIPGLLWAGALICSVLSIVAQTDLITVVLQTKADPKIGPYELRFGFLYEMNAGFFYLVVAPLFLLSVIVTVRRLQTAFLHLHARNRLVILNRDGQQTDQNPLHWIAAANTKVFRLPVLAALFVVPGFIVIGTEFNPWTGGDFRNAAFGYIQAPAIPTYPNLYQTLADLHRHRRIQELPQQDKNTPAIAEADYRKWTISAVRGGPDGAVKQIAFWLFVPAILLLQTAFLSFALWTTAKVVFVLWIIYVSFDRKTARSPGLSVLLDFSDTENSFGLSSVTRVYMPVLLLIGLALIGKASAQVANIAKGSQADPMGPVSLASVGQGSNLILPVMALLAFAVYAILLYVRADTAREEYTFNLLANPTSKTLAKSSETEDSRRLAMKQNLLPDDQFKALAALVGAVILVLKPTYITAVVNLWHQLVQFHP